MIERPLLRFLIPRIAIRDLPPMIRAAVDTEVAAYRTRVGIHTRGVYSQRGLFGRACWPPLSARVFAPRPTAGSRHFDRRM